MRTYGEAVDVRPASSSLLPDEPAGGPAGSAVEPGQFLWRGRLYVVRAVLAHWVELGPWWTGATSGPAGARAARRTPTHPTHVTHPGVDRAAVDAAAVLQGSRASAARAAVGEPEPQLPERVPRSVARDVGAVEREVWRVEARAGRSASVGVYDLVRDVPAPGPAGSAESAGDDAARSRWRLARALD